MNNNSIEEKIKELRRIVDTFGGDPENYGMNISEAFDALAAMLRLAVEQRDEALWDYLGDDDDGKEDAKANWNADLLAAAAIMQNALDAEAKGDAGLCVPPDVLERENMNPKEE